jgi:hypothetical protein
MYLDSRIAERKRGVRRRLEIIVARLDLLRIDRTGLDLAVGRQQGHAGVGRRNGSPSRRNALQTRAPEDVGGASDTDGARAVEEGRPDHRAFRILAAQQNFDSPGYSSRPRLAARERRPKRAKPVPSRNPYFLLDVRNDQMLEWRPMGGRVPPPRGEGRAGCATFCAPSR